MERSKKNWDPKSLASLGGVCTQKTFLTMIGYNAKFGSYDPKFELFLHSVITLQTDCVYWLFHYWF